LHPLNYETTQDFIKGNSAVRLGGNWANFQQAESPYGIKLDEGKNDINYIDKNIAVYIFGTFLEDFWWIMGEDVLNSQSH